MLADRGMCLPVALDEFQQALHFFLCADGDANHAGAYIFSTIAEEHAFFLKLRAHFRPAGAEIREEKIAGAGIGLYVKFVKFVFKPLSGAQNVFNVELHRSRVADSCLGGGQRGYVDGERGRGASKDRERFRARDHGSEAEAGEAGGLGKSSRDEELGVLVDPWHNGDAGKFGVGFIDNDGSVCGSFQNRFDGGFFEKRAGRIVGITHKQDARTQSERVEHSFERELHRGPVALNFDFGSGYFAPVAVHGEGGFADNGGDASVDKGVEEEAQRVVAAVCEKDLLGRYPKMTGKTASTSLVLGIHREKFGSQLHERAPDSGRAAGGVFVEVEPEFVCAAFAGRFVSAAVEDGLACWQLGLHAWASFELFRRTSTALA